MKRLLLASVALLAAGCGHDYARSAAQIPVAPTIAAQPLPRFAAAPRLVALADAGARREVGLAWSSQRRLLPAAELFRTFVLRCAARTSG